MMDERNPVSLFCGNCQKKLVVFLNAKKTILLAYCEECGERIETAMAFTKEVDEILRRNSLG